MVMRSKTLKCGFIGFMAATVVCAAGCDEKAERGPVPVPDLPIPEFNEKLGRFSDCKAVEAVLREREESWRREAERYFVAQKNKVQVINRRTKEFLGVLELGDLSSPELYWTEGHLVVIGNASSQSGIVARFYSASDEEMPRLVRERRYSGSLLGTRLIGSRLFLVLKHYSLRLADLKEDRMRGVRCRDVFGPPISDFDLGFVSVFSVDVGEPEDERSVGFIGGGDHLYVSENSLFIVKEGVNWFSWDPRETISLL